MVFSKEYVTVLMTIVALLLSAYPVPLFNQYTLYLTFIPIVFLGRYTNVFYTVLSALIVGLVNVLIGDYTIIAAMILIVIAVIVGAVGLFLKQNDIISLQILNAISLVIFFILSLISPYYEITEVLFLIPISFILMITSSITFVDIRYFFSLVNRYENEDKFDYLTGLGNVKEFDRHLNETTSIAEKNNQSIGLLLIDIDGFKDVNDKFSHQSGDAVLNKLHNFLKIMCHKNLVFIVMVARNSLSFYTTIL